MATACGAAFVVCDSVDHGRVDLDDSGRISNRCLQTYVRCPCVGERDPHVFDDRRVVDRPCNRFSCPTVALGDLDERRSAALWRPNPRRLSRPGGRDRLTDKNA